MLLRISRVSINAQYKGVCSFIAIEPVPPLMVLATGLKTSQSLTQRIDERSNGNRLVVSRFSLFVGDEYAYYMNNSLEH